MSRVLVDLRRPDDEGNLVPVVGRVYWRRTARTVEGDVTVLPQHFSHDAREPVVVTVAPTGPGWCWQVREYATRGLTRYVLVPETEDLLLYHELVEVDPATLEPSSEALDGWTATLDQVSGLVSVAGEHRAAASTSATDAQAAATEAAAALDAFRALTDIATDGEGRWWLTLPTAHTSDGIHIIQTGASENE